MKYSTYEVRLMFGGDDCPQLPDKTFIVKSQTPDGAVNLATYDAMSMGYKRSWVVGHEVVVLS